MIDSKFYLHDEYIFPKLYLKTKKGIWLFNYIFFSCKRNEGGREYEANNPTNFNNISQPSAKLIRSNETSRFNYSLRSTVRGKKKKKKREKEKEITEEKVWRRSRKNSSNHEEEEEEEEVSIDNIRPRK